MRASDPTLHRPRTFSPGLLLIPAASTGFGAVSGVAIDATLPLAGFGLVWGIAAMFVAQRLASRGARSPALSQAPLLVACGLAFMSIGGAIVGDLLSPNPQADFEMLHQPAFGMYFAIIHMTFEWLLLPAALMLNWTDRRRRRLLVVAAISFYAIRMVSAVYFAPTAMEWTDLPADTVVSGQLRADIEQWTTLNLLVRRPLQELLVTTLLVITALRRRVRSADRPSVSAG